jgi:ATP adenylyltransferase
VRTIVDRGVNVELRYVDALSHKDAERAVSGDRPAGQRAPFNPFLPYDERLFVADAGPEHVIILNKFPAIPNHVLLITRAFVDQEAILSVADFTAIAQLMAGMRGIVFFNGGRTGGGSQPHRHFQLIPVDALPVEAALPGQGSMHAQQLDSLPWRHAFAQHAFDPHADAQDNGARLFDIFRQCCASAGVVEQGERLSPFNLLLTRRWMMVIPRTRECWEHAGQSISINALGFGGMLLLRSPELAATVEQFGALSILTSVTQ